MMKYVKISYYCSTMHLDPRTGAEAEGSICNTACVKGKKYLYKELKRFFNEFSVVFYFMLYCRVPNIAFATFFLLSKEKSLPIGV